MAQIYNPNGLLSMYIADATSSLMSMAHSQPAASQGSAHCQRQLSQRSSSVPMASPLPIANDLTVSELLRWYGIAGGVLWTQAVGRVPLQLSQKQPAAGT